VSPPPSLNLPWAKSIENAAPSSEKKPRNKNVPIKPRLPPASMRLRQRLTLGASPAPHQQGIVMAFSDVFLGLTALFAAVALGTIIMSRPSTQGVPGGDH